MPSPIIHLHGAFLAQKHLAPAFILGTVAPDAIHQRPGATWSDKAKTHFYEAADKSYELGIEGAKDMLGLKNPLFSLGYLNHLYMDYVWRDFVYAPFFKERAHKMERSKLHQLYYCQMQQLDRAILQEAFWLQDAKRLLEAAEPLELPLLSAAEIHGWRLKVLADLKNTKPHSDYPDLFPKEMIDDFFAQIKKLPEEKPRE